MQILAILRDLALRGGGYERFSVRGWARTEEVAERLGRKVPERLPELHRWGCADRVDARHPGRVKRPMWLYRINEEGLRLLVEGEGTAASAPLPAPEWYTEARPPIFLPRECVDFLALSRKICRDPAAPKHVWGQHGWALLGELRERAERSPERTGRFLPEDVELLMRAGLVERRERAEAGRARYVYRVTVAGVQAKILEWREPQ